MSEITLAELEQKMNKVKYFNGFLVYRGKKGESYDDIIQALLTGEKR